MVKQDLLGFYKLTLGRYLKFENPKEVDDKKALAEIRILKNDQSSLAERYLLWSGDGESVFLGQMKSVTGGRSFKFKEKDYFLTFVEQYDRVRTKEDAKPRDAGIEIIEVEKEIE